MPDYKSMYFHMAGRVAGTVETLEVLTETLRETHRALRTLAEASVETLKGLSETLKKAQTTSEETLEELTEYLKKVQLTTEEMFVSAGHDGSAKEEETDS